MLKITEFPKDTILKNITLQEQAAKARWGYTRQFIATIDNGEAGFLSFEDRSDISIGMIYEILVLPQFRNKGIGSALLSRAEILAISLGCNRVQITVNAFDRSVQQKWLEDWYALKGYSPTSEASEDFYKMLPAGTTN